ncbi:MAG: hypothetical protein ACNFW9_02590 [Candidatus Kerfeldbacteria bacterium]
MVKKPKKKRRIRIGYTKKRYTKSKIESLMKSQLYVNDYQLVMMAYGLALLMHWHVFRGDMAKYFEHCKSVALIIILEFKVFLVNPIVVAFLHDIMEDVNKKSDNKKDSPTITWWTIQRMFGKTIYRGLRIISKEDEKDYYLGIENVQPRDWWIILVKLADRLHNIRNILHMSKKFMLRQLRETEMLYPHLLEVFEDKIPRRFKYLPDYIRGELEFACNKIRKKLGMPKSSAFKRVK